MNWRAQPQAGPGAARAERATPEAGIVELARRVGLQPDGRQKEMLESGARQMLVCCSRQWGKSTAAALKALATAEGEAGSLVVVVAPTERQAGLLVEKVREMAEAAGIPTKGMASHRAGLRLKNGSRVVGLADMPKTVRGYSAPRLVVVDEAAFVDEAIFGALRPMLATGRGSMWLLSTPNGKQGYFYEQWTEGGPGWVRVKATAEECERIDQEFLREEKERLGSLLYAQEYLCEFVAAEGPFFPPELLEGIVETEERR